MNPPAPRKPPDKTTNRMTSDRENRGDRTSADLKATRIAIQRPARRREAETSQSTCIHHVCSYCQGPFQNNPDNPNMLPYDTACGSEIHQICLLLHQFYCDLCRQHECSIPGMDNSCSTHVGTANAQSSGQHRRTHSQVTQRFKESTEDAVETTAAGTVKLTPESLSDKCQKCEGKRECQNGCKPQCLSKRRKLAGNLIFL